MSDQSYDAAVIGAGPGGSAVAAALAQKGWHVLLLEQDELPRHKVCGQFLSPEAQDSLRRLGLLEAVEQLKPAALHEAELTSPSGRRVQTALPGRASGVSRFGLDDVLASGARASGADVWTGVSVLDFSERNGTYALRLRARGQAQEMQRPDVVRARLVILAAGRHNRLAQAEDSPASESDRMDERRHVGIACHYEGVRMPGRVALYFFDGGYGGINPVEGGRANLCLLVTYEAFRRHGSSPAAMLEAVRRKHPSLDRRLGDAPLLPETLKTVAAVNTSQPANPWRGAPCVGDAAAMITPLCGDGMAMALRAAEICAPPADAYLHGRIGRTEFTHTYARAWHDEFDRRLRIGRLLQSALGRPRLADALIRIGGLSPPLVDYLVHATRGPASGRATAASG